MPSSWEPDQRLLDEVAAALRPSQAVPESLVTAAKAAWTWRTVDEELAALAYDSVLEAAGTRSAHAPGSTSTLVFDAPGLVVSIEVGAGLLRGQLAPVRRATVVVVTADGGTTGVRDLGHGAFTATDLADGPVRLRIVDDAQRTVLTPWFRVPAA